MAVTNTPPFAQTPNIGLSGYIVAATTANVKSDGSGTIGTDLIKCGTAGANGSYLSKIRIFPVATTAATTLAATVLRFFLSSLASGATTAGTNTVPLCGDLAITAVAIDNTTAATQFYEIAINAWINPSYTILASTHIAAAANSGYIIVPYFEDL